MCSTKNWSKGSIRANGFLKSIPKAPVNFDLHSDLNSDSGIWSIYAGSAGHPEWTNWPHLFHSCQDQLPYEACISPLRHGSLCSCFVFWILSFLFVQGALTPWKGFDYMHAWYILNMAVSSDLWTLVTHCFHWFEVSHPPEVLVRDFFILVELSQTSEGSVRDLWTLSKPFQAWKALVNNFWSMDEPSQASEGWVGDLWTLSKPSQSWKGSVKDLWSIDEPSQVL